MSTTRASDEGCPASILDGTFSSGRIMLPPGPHRDSYSKGKLAIPDGYLALGLYLCFPKFVSEIRDRVGDHFGILSNIVAHRFAD